MNATQVPAWPPLPPFALEVLFATQRAGLQHWQPVADAIEHTERARLLRRVLPSQGLDELSERDARVLAYLLYGDRTRRGVLSDELEMSDRTIRLAVAALRHAGFPIVSRSIEGEAGYLLTDDPDAIEEYIEREVRPRAMREHEIESRMHEAVTRSRANTLEGAVQPAQLGIPDLDPSGGCEQ